MAKSGQYEKVWIHRSYTTTTGVKTKPRRFPDILGKRKTGQFDPVEVPSASDYRRGLDHLYQRNLEALQQLPAQMRGNIRIEEIK